MATHRFTPTHYHTTMGPHEPVVRIGDGDTVITTTVDARGRDSTGEQVTAPGNPQTGPFYVEGAVRGDTLAVRFDRLWPNRPSGWTRTRLAAGVIDPEAAAELPRGSDPLAQWDLDLERGTASLAQPETGLGRFTLPLAPMLGCFGVAPWGEQAISTATSAEHGGNMDYRGFVEGVTVYFPVFAPGALLFVGDGHAVQGDGEIVGTGIETSFDVQFSVRILKGKRIGWPRAENASHWITIGNARPLDQALQHATTEMQRLLVEDAGLDVAGAHLLLGLCVEYAIGNVFDPAYTIACKMAKEHLPRHGPAKETPPGR